MTFREYSGHQSRKTHNRALKNYSSSRLCSFGKHETTELTIESFVQNETKAGLFSYSELLWIGPGHDPVTYYGINYAGTQIMQWDFQNKGRPGWTGESSFVLEVPLRYLRPQHNLFRTMWPDPAKSLLIDVHQTVDHQRGVPSQACSTVRWCSKTYFSRFNSSLNFLKFHLN